MTNLENAKEALLSGDFTCVLCRENEKYTSRERGVKPLILFCKSGEIFKDFSAADKVIGKATAFLYVLLGVKSVYAAVVSRSALSILVKNGIKTEYDCLVDHIINRTGDGICPFEAAVLNTDAPEKAYSIIISKAEEMGIMI